VSELVSTGSAEYILPRKAIAISLTHKYNRQARAILPRNKVAATIWGFTNLVVNLLPDLAFLDLTRLDPLLPDLTFHEREALLMNVPQQPQLITDHSRPVLFYFSLFILYLVSVPRSSSV
jgi:hypothetical protein